MTKLAAGHFYFAGMTDVGRTRSHNEDCFSIDQELGLVLVADGMGGHANGDLASRTAVEAVCDFIVEYAPDDTLPLALSPDDDTVDEADDDDDSEKTVVEKHAPELVGRDHPVALIRAAVQLANQRINTLNQERGMPEGRGMGTTLVGLWLIREKRQAIVFHAGDSRLYRLRGGELQQLTHDHSLYQAWLDNGGHGQAPSRNIIVRALGMSGRIDPEISIHAIEIGDTFLACSDGLTGMIEDPGIAELLRGVAPATIEDVCARLVDQANANGGRDNVTAVLAHWC